MQANRPYLECAMVAQHLFRAPNASEQTLDAVWRLAAQRLTHRGRVAGLTLGLVAVSVSAITQRFPLLATLGTLAAAFACYAGLIQPPSNDRWVSPSAVRALAAFATLVAALAALATGLFLLAAMFGGSIEVMRR
jgi:hypothetical protein